MSEKKEFNFLITTLAGSRLLTFLKLSFTYGVERPFLMKWLISLFVSIICTILGWFDQLRFSFMKKSEGAKNPVFIIGHWRSGTTYLHNLMCLDPDASYTTTYQTVFPNNLFAFQWLFKPIMKSMMPDSRPVDNVKLHADFPQEEEFALNNEYHYSHYNWWYFPQKTKPIVDRFLLGKTTSPQEQKKFEDNYKRFVQRCMLNTKGSRFVSKNPPHTARVTVLKKLFPKAKFIFIHRNPYEVVRSTFNFYKSILPATQLQAIDDDQLMRDILMTYREMMTAYEMQKKDLSEGDLLEIAYADLVKAPEQALKNIYDDFLNEDYDAIRGSVKNHIKENHALKAYQFSEDYIQNVNGSLLEVIQRQGYEVL